ncbi:hypothetical protein [Nocardia thraciensis]
MTALNATTASKAPRRAPRKPRRAVAVAAIAAGAALALSGCGAGQISQTASQVAAVNGNSADVGKVALRDVRILLPQSGQYTNAKGGKAVLAFSAVNAGESKSDELTSITSDLGPVKITPGSPQLKFQQTVVAGLQAAPAGEQAGHGDEHAAPTSTAAPTSSAAPTTAAPSSATASSAAHPEGLGAAEHPAEPGKPILVEITGLTQDITPGLTYRVTFNFKENGTVQVDVPVDAGPDTARKEGKAAEGAGEGKSGH